MLRVYIDWLEEGSFSFFVIPSGQRRGCHDAGALGVGNRELDTGGMTECRISLASHSAQMSWGGSPVSGACALRSAQSLACLQRVVRLEKYSGPIPTSSMRTSNKPWRMRPGASRNLSCRWKLHEHQSSCRHELVAGLGSMDRESPLARSSLVNCR